MKKNKLNCAEEIVLFIKEQSNEVFSKENLTDIVEMQDYIPERVANDFSNIIELSKLKQQEILKNRLTSSQNEENNSNTEIEDLFPSESNCIDVKELYYLVLFLGIKTIIDNSINDEYKKILFKRQGLFLFLFNRLNLNKNDAECSIDDNSRIYTLLLNIIEIFKYYNITKMANVLDILDDKNIFIVLFVLIRKNYQSKQDFITRQFKNNEEEQEKKIEELKLQHNKNINGLKNKVLSLFSSTDSSSNYGEINSSIGENNAGINLDDLKSAIDIALGESFQEHIEELSTKKDIISLKNVIDNNFEKNYDLISAIKNEIEQKLYSAPMENKSDKRNNSEGSEDDSSAVSSNKEEQESKKDNLINSEDFTVLKDDIVNCVAEKISSIMDEKMQNLNSISEDFAQKIEAFKEVTSKLEQTSDLIKTVNSKVEDIKNVQANEGEITKSIKRLIEEQDARAEELLKNIEGK